MVPPRHNATKIVGPAGMLKDLETYLAENNVGHLHALFTKIGIDEPRLLAKLRYSDLGRIGIENLIERRQVFDAINDINQDMYAEEMTLKENESSDMDGYCRAVQECQDRPPPGKNTRTRGLDMHEREGALLDAGEKRESLDEDAERSRKTSGYASSSEKAHSIVNESLRLKDSPSSSGRLSSKQEPATASGSTSMVLGDIGSFTIIEESRHKGAKITVCVRKRPCSKPDADIIDVESNGITVNEPKLRVDLEPYTEKHRFSYDHCFDGDRESGEIYKRCVKEVVQHAISNGSGTVLAYGQTGTGKTYTMLERKTGIVYLALRDILRSERTGTIAFCEIYMGQVHDLLNGGERIALREANGVVHFSTSREMLFKTLDEAYRTIELGLSLRKTGITGANAKSSRSHAVIIVRLMQDGSGSANSGTIFFVDLAGSERGSDRKDMGMEVKNEGAEINKSLLALKECIRGIEKDSRHLPFRQSKLTQILKNSLVGSSRTCLIATISASFENVEHTLNTLRYAARIKENNSSEQRDGNRSICSDAPQKKMSPPHGSSARNLNLKKNEVITGIKRSLGKLIDANWLAKGLEELGAVLNDLCEIERKYIRKA
jgi:kinesin family member 2/24